MYPDVLSTKKNYLNTVGQIIAKALFLVYILIKKKKITGQLRY